MYRVEILVDDGNNYATVVVLNKEMLKLTKQDAATLLLNEVISKPQTLIKTVAITQISKKLQVNRGITLYTHLDDFNNNETPYAVREFSEASTSASPINTSTVEVEQGGRKDARD
uniref:Uncharacterized protein n=1 Tax=Brassica oleracea TaxID=3712 RepID=A0A3P6DYD3_BRAOL|nr:unnamed protein product [Brassica oleracea]